ncbi:MAG TPA: hypothetical protein DGH68_00875 [Bacteroidetes bacterium]|nr:hypothetical protein [Bacteroidota bacterium]
MAHTEKEETGFCRTWVRGEVRFYFLQRVSLFKAVEERADIISCTLLGNILIIEEQLYHFSIGGS